MLDAAAARGLDVEVHPRPPARSLEEAARVLGIEPADIAKTLVIRRSGGDHLFALVGGDRQLAWPKLRALLGVSKLSLPDAAAALAATGYERGTMLDDLGW
jgi:prolyl-tRNA editing enzyme YbaK/EbsC (Cys-tRNA(Pro) deacylase)